MADGADTAQLTLQIAHSMSEIEARAWNALANPETVPFNPFVAHEFLLALEVSHSVSANAGWLPHHLLLYQDKTLAAAMPLYLKGHSQGEYIFDHAWADAFERAGGEYYPKLLCAIPFTPATGPRLLAPTPALRLVLSQQLAALTDRLNLSSAHINFITEAEKNQIEADTFLQRSGLQYHWFNQAYQSWNDFAQTLASRKRKALNKERACLRENGITIERVTGADIGEQHLDAFWQFYQNTGARKWGQPYLTRQFFSEITQVMNKHILFIFAKRGDKYIAGAMNMIGGDTLYGRYWGCIEHVPFLHFELCYYQAIDYAIEHGLTCVEAGAQGEHKIARGYQPVITHSAHYIPHEGFRRAVAHYLDSERRAVQDEADILTGYTPFKKDER